MSKLINTAHSFLEVRSFTDNEDLIKKCVDDVDSLLLNYPPIMLYGKQARQRRCIGFFSDDSVGYTYSRQLCKSQPLSDNLKNLLTIINGLYGSNFNGILVNKYNNGEDYICKHSDDEEDIDSVGVISLSYGASRKFRIRDKKTNKIVQDIMTKNNYLIQMAGDFQKEFTHEIPIEKKIKDVRYSFTFRKHMV